MSPDQEKQLHDLLGDYESQNVPPSLEWAHMELRLFPRRRARVLLWLLPLLLITGGLIFRQMTKGNEGQVITPPPTASKPLFERGVTSGPASTDLSLLPSPQAAVSRRARSRTIPMGSLDYDGVSEAASIPRSYNGTVAAPTIPTLPPSLIVVAPPNLSGLRLASAELSPAPATYRRFFSVAAGPGTFGVPLQPIASLPQDVTVESSFLRAHSLRLRVDVVQLGPLTVSTGMTYRRATNVSISSALLPVGRTISSEASSLQLPLLAGYNYGSGRWTFRAAAGCSVEVGSWVRGQILLPNGSAGPVDAYRSDTPALPLGLLGELGTEYRLWPRLGFTLGVSYSQGATRLRYPAFEAPGRQTYRGGVVGLVFYPAH